MGYLVLRIYFYIYYLIAHCSIGSRPVKEGFFPDTPVQSLSRESMYANPDAFHLLSTDICVERFAGL